MSSVPDLSESSTASTSSRSELDSLDTNYQISYCDTLLEDEHGILVVPSLSGSLEISLPCLFARVFDCEETHDDMDQWKTHATGHFETNPPPTGVNCLVCKQRFVDITSIAGSGSGPALGLGPGSSYESNSGPGSAWLNMLDHIIDRHSQHDNDALVDVFPDFELMSYMYCRGILKNEQFRSLQPSKAAPAQLQGDSEPLSESFFYNASSRRERRLRARHIPVG